MTNATLPAGYDVIGDVHGHGDELLALLEKLGYYHDGVSYTHEERKALFLGDFVDRGDQQKLVLRTVMAMCNRGSARAIMGNHEFNALAYHRQNPVRPGVWLRARNNKNTHQHIAFLSEYLGSEQELQSVLAWFMTLPLWIELPEGLRLVHACWHEPSIEVLEPLLGDDHTLTPELLVHASDSSRPEYTAVETLLKGRELALPQDISFKDKDGNTRHEMRIKWWERNPSNYADLALPPYVVERNPELADVALSDELETGYASSEVPVLFGHYWFEGEPAPVLNNLACLDYSVPRPSGKLVAYRWSGEAKLSPDNFVSVPNMRPEI
ncbi:MAG: metallophosphoesterase [Halioglobus sp.]